MGITSSPLLLEVIFRLSSSYWDQRYQLGSRWVSDHQHLNNSLILLLLESIPSQKRVKKKRPVQQDQSSSVQGQPRQGFGGDLQGQVPFGQVVQGQEFIQQNLSLPQFVPQQSGVPVSIPQSHGFVQQGQFMPQFLPQQLGPSPTLPQQQQQHIQSQSQVVPPVLTVQPVAVTAGSAVKNPGKGKKGVWCWKCSVDSHAVKDCKVKHYCYVCDRRAHPTQRCPVLRAPRHSAFVLGTCQIETYFTTLPDSVVHEDLVPTQSPVARVVISGDAVPADVVAKQVARQCPDRHDWKWEALPNGDMEFLISYPSSEDLDRVGGIQVTKD
jgi:hypothetical protein